MKNIIICLLFFNPLFLFSQNYGDPHQGKLYFDSQCQNVDCLDGKADEIQNWLTYLKNTQGLKVNIIVYSKDCQLIKDGNKLLGPNLEDKCVWKDPSVDYLLIFEPGMFSCYYDDDQIEYSSTIITQEGEFTIGNNHPNFSAVFNVINNAYLGDYSTKLLCQIDYALTAIENYKQKTPFGADLCKASVLDFINGFFIHTGSYLMDTVTTRLVSHRLISNHCTPVIVWVPFTSCGAVNIPLTPASFPPPMLWALENVIGPNFLLFIAIPEAGETKTTFTDFKVLKFTDVNVPLQEPLDKCYSQLLDLTETNLEEVALAVKNGSNQLELARMNDGIIAGLLELEELLIANLGNTPSSTNCDFMGACEPTSVNVDFDFCIPLGSSSLSHLQLDWNGPTNPSQGIGDFGGLNTDERTSIKNAIDSVAQRWGLSSEFIISFDVGSPLFASLGGNNNDLPKNPTTENAFNHFNNVGTNKDLAIWVHYKNHDTLCFKIHIADDVFPSSTIGQGKVMFKDAIKNFASTNLDEYEDPTPVPNVESAGANGSNAWRFGIRPGHEHEKNFWSMSAEIIGILKETTVNGMPEDIWKPNGKSMFDIPGGVAGVGDGIAGQVAGTIQMLSFIHSISTDKQTRDGIKEAILNPGMIAKEIYKDYKEIFTNSDKVEERWYEGGVLCTEVLFGLFSGGVTGLSKAGQISSKINVDLKKVFKTPEELKDLPLGKNFYKRQKALLPNEADWADFKEFMGSLEDPDLQKKIFDNPSLIDTWKNLKGQLSCPLGLIGPEFSGGTDECLKDLVGKLPEDNSKKFYDSYEKVFGLVEPKDLDPEDLEIVKDFCGDIVNAPLDFVTEIKKNPELIEVWEDIHELPDHCTDPKWLNRVKTWKDADEKIKIEGIGGNPDTEHISISFEKPSTTPGQSVDVELGAVYGNDVLALNYPNYTIPSEKTIGEKVGYCQFMEVDLNGGNKDFYFKRIPDESGLEEVLNILKGGPFAHTLDVHGFDIPDEALKRRANEGIDPRGKKKLPPYDSATKFNDANAIKKALDIVGPNSPIFNQKRNIANSHPKENVILIPKQNIDENIGTGYLANSDVKIDEITTVTAVYRRIPGTENFYLETMFPHK